MTEVFCICTWWFDILISASEKSRYSFDSLTRNQNLVISFKGKSSGTDVLLWALSSQSTIANALNGCFIKGDKLFHAHVTFRHCLRMQFIPDLCLFKWSVICKTCKNLISIDADFLITYVLFLPLSKNYISYVLRKLHKMPSNLVLIDDNFLGWYRTSRKNKIVDDSVRD